MRHFFTTLRFRLFLLVFLAVLPALGLILYSGQEQRRIAVNEAKKDVQDLVRYASMYQEQVVEGARQLLTSLAELPMVQHQDGPACTALFARILEKQKIYANISVINLQGLPFASGLPHTPRSQLGRTHFERALKTRDFAIGEFAIGRASDRPTLHFAYPIIVDGEVVGVVACSVALDYLNQMLAKTHMPPGALLTVLDRGGTILARYPQPDQWVGKRLPEAEIIKIVLAKREGVAEAAGLDGVRCLFAFSPLGAGSQDLFIYTGAPLERIYAESRRILTRNLLALGGVTLLALALAWMLGHFFLITRTRALVAASRRMADGDLKVRSHLSYDDGEFGQLARSFDDMAATLEQRQDRLRESEEKYRTLAENIDLGITLISSDYKIIMTNAAMGKLFQKPVQDFVGKYCFQEFEKRDAVCAHCPAVKAMASGQPREVDTIGVHDDGSFHYAHVRTFPTFDSRGTVTGFVEVVEDTTARRQAEEQLAWEDKINSAMVELSRALLASRSIQDISQMVLDRALALTESSVGYCGYLDPATGYFIVPTLSREVWEVCQVPDKNIVFKEFNGLWGYGLKHRQPVLTNTPAADSRSSGTPSGHIAIRNFVAVPAMIGEELLGQVAVANATRNYLARDQEVCERLALFYALAIQRQRVEAALSDSEARYRLLAENVRDVIWTMDLNRRFTYVSAAIQALAGYSPEEFLSLDLGQFLTPASLKIVQEGLTQLQEINLKEKPVQPPSAILQAEHVGKDGASRWVEIHVTLLRDAHGEPTGFAGITRDITRRKQMLEALKESEQRFADIARNVAEWVWEVDPEGRFTYSSPVAEQLLGYQPAEVLGKYFYDFFIPGERQEAKDKAFAIIAARQTFRDFINRTFHKNGAIAWLSTSGVPVIDAAGNLLGYRGASIDITARRQAQEALENANIQLQALVYAAEERNTLAALLNDMSEMLQTCQTLEEAFAAINHFVPKFFPEDSGALYLLRDSKNLLSAVTTWGDIPPSGQPFGPDDCWAVRSGRPHWVDDPASPLLCKHISPAAPRPLEYLCVPLMAQTVSLGILHVRFIGPPAWEGSAAGLAAKQRLAVTIAENLALSLANLKLRETLQNQAIRDPLTGLYNRRYLEETMDREIHRSRRLQVPLGVVMMDLDHFKAFNDGFGHGAGDALLIALAHVLTAGIRSEDIVCRFGGEEFLLVLPGASLETTRERAEKIRQAVKAHQVKYQGRFLRSPTISLGVAVLPDHGSTSEELIGAADAALYRAKQAGRDRVEVAAPGPPATAAP